MDYRTLFKEDNDSIRERYDLAIWRIEQMLEEQSIQPPFDRFFKENARWILMCDRLFTALERDELENADGTVWKKINHCLYASMYGSKMAEDFGNPSYAKRYFGDELGPHLSCLFHIMRCMIPAVWECRRVAVTICMELFIEIYNIFEYEKVTANMISRTIYWFISDYADEFMTYKIRELSDGQLDRYERIFRAAAGGQDEMVLYMYGLYVPETAIDRWRRWKSADPASVEALAQMIADRAKQASLTRKGGRYILSYHIGDEPLAAKAAQRLSGEDYEPMIVRGSAFGISGLSGGAGILSEGGAYTQAHRSDILYYADRALYERYLAVAQSTLEKHGLKETMNAGCVFVSLPFQEHLEENKKLCAQQNAHGRDYCGKIAALERKYLGTGAQTVPVILV